MNNKDFNNIKKTYLAIQPDQTAEEGWQALYNRLPQQDSPIIHPRFRFGYAFIGMGGVLCIIIALFGFSHNSKPGDTLYPVQVLSDKIVQTVMGKPESTLEKKVVSTPVPTRKIPEVSNTPTPTTPERKQGVEGASTIRKQTTPTEIHKSVLEIQRDRLEDVLPENAKAEEVIEGIIERPEQSKGEEKSTENSNRSDHAGSENSNKGKKE